MKKFTFSLIAALFCICFGLNAQAQTVPEGETDITTLPWSAGGNAFTNFNNENASTVFGTDDGGDNLPYVDLSDYGIIKLYGTAGQKARLFINRSEFTNNTFNVTFNDEGVGIFDCNTILTQQPRAQYIHLNGVKAESWNTNLNVSMITVSGDPIEFPTLLTLPEDEYDITALPWVNEGQECSNNLGANTDATIFGTDATPGSDQLSYVDITNYGSLKIYGHAGDVVRLFINRVEYSNNFTFNVTIGNDNIGTFDLKNVYTTQDGAEYIHLNGIKALYGSKAKVDVIGLTDKPIVIPEDEIDITTLPWVNEGNPCETNNFYNLTDATIYGTHDGANEGKLSYVDITDYATVKLYGRAGDVVRLFINRAEYSENFEFYVTIGENGVALFNIEDVYTRQNGAEYVHLNGVKTAATWSNPSSPTGKAKIFAITLLEKQLFTITDELLTPEHTTNHIAKNSDGEWAANAINLDEAFDFKLAMDVKADAVTYTREVAADKWSAICMPFDVPFTALADYDVIKVSSINGTEVTFEYLTETEDMVAHTPYLIKTSNTGIAFNIENTTVKATAEATSEATGVTLVGVYKAQVIPAGCYGLAGGEFKKASENNTNKLKPYRAYLQTASNGAQQLKISVNGNTSNIEDIETSQPSEGVFYNLKGQKVNNPTTGIYIFNGVKVFVK